MIYFYIILCKISKTADKIEEIILSEEIQKISATKIRAKMREDGKLE